MKRHIEIELKKWKSNKEPIPLLIRGARQVGKSYTIEKFAKENFDNYIVINFEYEPEYKKFFEETLNPETILEKISALKNIKPRIGKTLVFLDEIQLCPQAILSLRYFYEKMPGFHIIGAGSLLDFVLNSGEISIPVGRIQYLFMQPMSFYEYLDLRHDSLLDYLRKVKLQEGIDPTIHKQLLKYLREYFILGGMPKVIDKYIETSNFLDPLLVQTRILQSYKDDFGKYAKHAKHKYLEKVFERAPKTVSNKFKYSHIDPELRTNDLKEALELLIQAGLIHKIKRTSGAGLPLEAESSEKHFKALMLDIGLMQKQLGTNKGIIDEIIKAEDFHSIASGALAEQFVGQELIAYQSPYEERRTYFWQRDKKNSEAEIDYLISNKAKVVPIEDKAGKTGKLRSLRVFMKEYSTSFALRISQKDLYLEGEILSIPFYMLGDLDRLLAEL